MVGMFTVGVVGGGEKMAVFFPAFYSFTFLFSFSFSFFGVREGWSNRFKT